VSSSETLRYCFSTQIADKKCFWVSLSHFLALKFGYKDVDSMKQDSQQRFSLLKNGILDKPSAKTLLVNVGASRSPSFRLLLQETNAF